MPLVVFFITGETNKTFFSIFCQLRIESRLSLLENSSDIYNPIKFGPRWLLVLIPISNFNRSFKTLKSKSPQDHAKN